MLRLFSLIGTLALALCGTGCAFHTTATEWHGRVGADGKPIYFTSATQVGCNLLIIIPFLGDLAIDGMVDELTEEIRQNGGDNISIVQGSSENYWYGFSPFTWIVSPVVSTLAAEYRPSPEQFKEDREKVRQEHVQDLAGKLSGTVTYRERIAMQPRWTVHVRLVQIIEGEKRPEIIDDYEIYEPGNVPVPFELRYDPDDIDKTGHYEVQAEIRDLGKVLWKNTEKYKVLTGGAPNTVEVVVVRQADTDAGERAEPPK